MAVAKWLVEKSSSSPSCKCSTALTLSDSPALSLWFSLTWWIPADRCEQSQTDLQSIAPHFLGFDSSSAPQTILCIPCAFLLLHPQPLTWSFAAEGAHCNHQHDVLYLQLRCYYRHCNMRANAQLGKTQGILLDYTGYSQHLTKREHVAPKTWFLWVLRELTLPESHAQA